MSLRLPNFLEDNGLNALRNLMSAGLVEYESDIATARRISRRDLDRLQSTGITIDDLQDVEILQDGTFSYQGVPILLYIMSTRKYRETQALPKYHVCNCQTWESMKAKGRQDRYVASTRIDGLFELEIIGLNGVAEQVTEALSVCKNCLDRLQWKGFNFSEMRRSERNRIFDTFALSEFFEVKNRTLVREKPRWTPKTFPGGSYTDDFDEISSVARAAAKWRCQDCGRLFAASWQRQYLHVHHENGVAGDNNPDNLRVYCLGCHASRPGHGQMTRSKQYIEFQRLFGSRQ